MNTALKRIGRWVGGREGGGNQGKRKQMRLKKYTYNRALDFTELSFVRETKQTFIYKINA